MGVPRRVHLVNMSIRYSLSFDMHIETSTRNLLDVTLQQGDHAAASARHAPQQQCHRGAMATAALVVFASVARLSDGGTPQARLLAEPEPACAIVDPSSSGWRQDPNADAEYQKQTADNPDAPPFRSCLNRKCFSYKLKVANWLPYQLISLTWHETIQVDAVYGADMAANSEGAPSRLAVGSGGREGAQGCPGERRWPRGLNDAFRAQPRASQSLCNLASLAGLGVRSSSKGLDRCPCTQRSSACTLSRLALSFRAPPACHVALWLP